MPKKQNSKVTISSTYKIKELAAEIAQLDNDQIICLFKKVDGLCSDCCFIGHKWNDCFQRWIDERTEQLNINEGFPVGLSLTEGNLDWFWKLPPH